MLQGESSEWLAIAGALAIEVSDLQRLLPCLNALGTAYLTVRAVQKSAWSRALTVSRLRASGLTPDDCRVLIDRGLAKAHGKNGVSRGIAPTSAGLLVLQAAVPLGAIRPVYELASHKLTVAGHLILQPAVQARNLSAVLATLEDAGWATRVEKPLAGRHCANDPHSLRAALSTLSSQQRVIDFHAHDGAATWNWRLE